MSNNASTNRRRRGRAATDGSDLGGYPADQTTVRVYGDGHVTNSNGTQIGQTVLGDRAGIRHQKSTGDTAPGTYGIPYKDTASANHVMDQYVNQQNRKQRKGIR